MAKSLNDTTGLNITGHVLIEDVDTNAILLDKQNAINFENISFALANLLAGVSNDYAITAMEFGNGGTTVDNEGIIIYDLPNVGGNTATLHQKTFEKVITGTTGNLISVEERPGFPYSDVVVECTLDYDEPSDAEDLDIARS